MQQGKKSGCSIGKRDVVTAWGAWEEKGMSLIGCEKKKGVRGL